MITFKLFKRYHLSSKINDQKFTGVLISRTFNLGPALSGHDQNGRKCHFPLNKIIESNWDIKEEDI